MRQPTSPPDDNLTLLPAKGWLQQAEPLELFPQEDRDPLLTTVAEAVDLAGAGKVEAGHDLLVWALLRAEDHWNGNSWGRELVLCYQEALERYDRR